jgi:hypothetical protein
MLRKVLTITGIVLGVLLLLIGIFAAYIYFAPTPSHKKVELLDIQIDTSAEMITKGEKLVLSNCKGCHGNENGILDGKKMDDVPANKAFGTLYASNLTQHEEFGIGSYTDAELYRLLRTGVKKNNKLATVVMPRWAVCEPEDIYSMIAFLRSDHKAVQASDNELPKHKSSFLERALMKFAFKPVPYQDEHFKRPKASDSIAYGKYAIQAVYGCYMCHSGDLEKANVLEPEKTPNYLGGGYEFQLAAYSIAVPSLLSDSKISTWSVEQFVKAVRDGKRPGVEKDGYLEPMHTYPLLDSLEVSGMYHYLKSLD